MYSKYGLNLCCRPLVPGNQILLVLGPTTNQNLEYIFRMRVQGLSPQTDERTEDLQPTLFWKEYISSAKIIVEFILCGHIYHTFHM